MLLAETLRSSTLRLALIWIAGFGIAIVALFGYVYWTAAGYVRGHAERAVAAESARLQQRYDAAGRSAVSAAIAQRLAGGMPAGDVVLFADPAFVPLAGNLAAWPEVPAAADGWSDFVSGEGGDVRTLRARVATLPSGEHLLVAADIGDLDRLLRNIRTTLGLSLALVFVLAGVASISVTRRTVGRIEGINAISRAIMESGLDKRIALRGTRDEWDQLAQNLNSMLDRIEILMGEVRQATDNVAHDLRTPLTRMRGRLERAGSAPRTATADQALINDTLADLDGVLRMFASLTRISQIETSDRMVAFRAVDLTGLARDVVELFDAAAEEKGARLDVTGDACVLATGDRDLLFDAIANLVDNAIKHGHDAGHVTVDVRRAADGPAVAVIDDGPGIPADESQHVFQRFYRLERSRRTPGNGLGLSLVAAVARLHGVRIDLIDSAPGLIVRLRFPAGAAPDDATRTDADKREASVPG